MTMGWADNSGGFVRGIIGYAAVWWGCLGATGQAEVSHATMRKRSATPMLHRCYCGEQCWLLAVVLAYSLLGVSITISFQPCFARAKDSRPVPKALFSALTMPNN